MRFLLAAACAGILAAAPVDTVRELVKTHCTRCHGPEQSIAGLDFSTVKDAAQIIEHRKTWTRVIDKVNTREMPPAAPLPSEEDRQRLTSAIQQVLRSVEVSKIRNPGAVTIPRLNREEYNNTIRDLTGLDLRPADAFPVDPPGQTGFDNDREGLFLPPLLLEKYLAAANLVVDEWVLAARPCPRFSRVIEVEDMRITETQVAKRPYGHDVAAVQNTIYDYITFPAAGVYTFRVLAWGTSDGAGLIPGVSLRIANQLRGQAVVEATKDQPGTYTFRTTVRSGSQRVSLHYFAQPTRDTKIRKAKKAEARAVLSLDRMKIEADSAPVAPVVGPGGARKSIAAFAERAWRRPVTGAEIAGLMRLAGGKQDDEAVGAAMKAVLVSPHFLFRIEGTPKPGADYRLNDFELASRLSYFLWLSMPDGTLFDLARRGKLRDPKVLQAQVRRMIADPRAPAFISSFFAQWLGYSELGKSVGPDRTVFPVWTDGLREAMLAEPAMFAEEMFRTDASLLGLVEAKHTFANEELARLYGWEGIIGRQMRRVDVSDPNRGGIVGMAGILTATSLPVRTSPVVRGKWLLETLLGEELPPPPANVGDLPEPKGELAKMTLRQRFEQHRKAPQCASCHNKIDPLGYGLENFDAVGRWRDKDNGQPVDAVGVLSSGERFQGPAGLKQVLMARKDVFIRALSARMLAFALGRELRYYDGPVVDQVAKAVIASGYRPSVLLAEVAGSYPFRYKRVETSQEASE